MKIASVKAFAVKIPRDLSHATGTAGSPARLQTDGENSAQSASSNYRWAKDYPTLYSTQIETTLVRVETDDRVIGWGEAQSPVAPEITATVINSLLGPLSVGEDALAPEAIWQRLYAAMRVRGHTGSFLLDAIAGIDIALWDVCGKAYGQPVHRLLGGPFREALPCYVSGLAGANNEERIAYARRFAESGARSFKLFLDGTERNLLALVDELRDAFATDVDIFVDALWRLHQKSALRLARQLEQREVGWLEAPLAPEDLRGHQRLASEAAIPIALGESYRTRFELLPFLEARAVDIIQPDIGRSGISEGRKIAALADAFHVPVAPHISIGLGPQIAAALHFGAATPNLLITECNPKVYEVANSFLREPIEYSPSTLAAPRRPGLGIEINEDALGKFLV